MDSLAEKIVAHVEQHIGPVARTIAGTSEGISFLHVAPVQSRPVHTLLSLGMSAHEMAVPSQEDAPRRLELMITLPQRWQLDEAALNNDAWAWPVQMLRDLVQWPASTGQWLGWGTAVPNGQPPRPYARSTKLCGAIIAPSLLVPAAFYELQLAAQSIVFYSAIPLYKEELSLHARDGMRVLLERLIDNDVNDVIEPRRKNAARRRWGLFG